MKTRVLAVGLVLSASLVRDGGRFIERSGGQPGTSRLLFMIPQEQFALALLANMNDVNLRDLAREIVQEMQLPFPAPVQH